MSRCLVVVILVVLSAAAASAEVIGFEPPTYTVGGALPSGWSVYKTAAVSTEYPADGVQSLAVGKDSNAKRWISLPASGKAFISVDIRPHDSVLPADYHFTNYGGVRIYYDPYNGGTEGILDLKLENWDYMTRPNSPSDWKVFFNGETVACFVPGTYYRFTILFDWDANTRTLRLERADGSTVAQKTYTSYPDATVTMVYLYGASYQANTYFDQLNLNTKPAVGMSNRTVADPLIPAAAQSYRITLWGRVTILNANELMLDDGSGRPVKVSAPGWANLTTGDYAKATGNLSIATNPALLSCPASDVVKLN